MPHAGSHLSQLRTWQGLVRKVRDKLGNMEELVNSLAKAVAFTFLHVFHLFNILNVDIF